MERLAHRSSDASWSALVDASFACEGAPTAAAIPTFLRQLSGGLKPYGKPGAQGLTFNAKGVATNSNPRHGLIDGAGRHRRSRKTVRLAQSARECPGAARIPRGVDRNRNPEGPTYLKQLTTRHRHYNDLQEESWLVRT